MKTSREIEKYLWSKRVSQNYKGFSFLVDALLLAEEEVPVNHALLVRIAEEHQTTAARVHSLLRTVLRQIRLMGGFPDELYPVRWQGAYLEIHYLHEELDNNRRRP